MKNKNNKLIEKTEVKKDSKDNEISEKEKKKIEKLKRKKLKLAQEFCNAVLKKYKRIIKAIVVFGSLTRNDFTEKSDIDILVIIDDTLARFTPEMKEAFDFKLQDIARNISESISVQPAWTLTEFWDMARIGHPLLYTIVRDGWALYDTGFFIPVRKLLEQGKIPHTIEAVEFLMQNAPKKISRVENIKLFMIAEDLYYAVLNASQAVLMYMGRQSPAPKQIIKDVYEYIVKTNMLEKKYLKYIERILKFRKDVEHKKIKNVSGEKLDKFIQMAKEYVEKMENILEFLRKKRKEEIIKRNYEVLIKGAITGLKSLGKLPEDPKDLSNAIKKYLIKEEGLSQFYENLFKKVAAMRKMVDENLTEKIPERDIELTREYVRRFIKEIENIIEKEKIKKTNNKNNK